MPKTIFYCLNSCRTCQKARAWLSEQGVDYTYRDLLKEPPGLEELKQLAGMGGIDLKGLVNPRSQAFKKLQPPLPDLDEAGVAELIKKEPRILVRPILVVDQKLATGFKEEEYQRLLA